MATDIADIEAMKHQVHVCFKMEIRTTPRNLALDIFAGIYMEEGECESIQDLAWYASELRVAFDESWRRKRWKKVEILVV